MVIALLKQRSSFQPCWKSKPLNRRKVKSNFYKVSKQAYTTFLYEDHHLQHPLKPQGALLLLKTINFEVIYFAKQHNNPLQSRAPGAKKNEAPFFMKATEAVANLKVE